MASGYELFHNHSSFLAGPTTALSKVVGLSGWAKQFGEVSGEVVSLRLGCFMKLLYSVLFKSICSLSFKQC